MAIAEMVRALLDAGAPADAIVRAVELMEQQASDRENTRLGKQRDRTSRHRAKRSVTLQNVTNVTKRSVTPNAREGAHEGAGVFLSSNLDTDNKNIEERDRRAGERACVVLSELEPLPDTAAAVHSASIEALEEGGFSVSPEYTVAIPDKERSGRIDIVATLKDGRVAIEIDARKPRRKSLLKLKLFQGFRIVALRGVDMPQPPDGIHATVGIAVKTATISEAADKRTVNRPCRLPDSWQPDVQFAVSEGMNPAEVQREVSKFRDYWTAQPPNKAAKTDWHATWRNWIRRVVDGRQAHPPPKGINGHSKPLTGQQEMLNAIKSKYTTDSDEDPFVSFGIRSH